jgi:hypothetical protein
MKIKLLSDWINNKSTSYNMKRGWTRCETGLKQKRNKSERNWKEIVWKCKIFMRKRQEHRLNWLIQILTDFSFNIKKIKLPKSFAVIPECFYRESPSTTLSFPNAPKLSSPNVRSLHPDVLYRDFCRESPSFTVIPECAFFASRCSLSGLSATIIPECSKVVIPECSCRGSPALCIVPNIHLENECIFNLLLFFAIFRYSFAFFAFKTLQSSVTKKILFSYRFCTGFVRKCSEI